VPTDRPAGSCFDPISAPRISWPPCRSTPPPRPRPPGPDGHQVSRPGSVESRLGRGVRRRVEKMGRRPEAHLRFRDWYELNNERTTSRNGVGPEMRTGRQSGGLKMVFTDSAGTDIGFLWMRGSGTEPVFRVMAEIPGRQTRGRDGLSGVASGHGGRGGPEGFRGRGKSECEAPGRKGPTMPTGLLKRRESHHLLLKSNSLQRGGDSALCGTDVLLSSDLIYPDLRITMLRVGFGVVVQDFPYHLLIGYMSRF
jgi:hypothetical protein